MRRKNIFLFISLVGLGIIVGGIVSYRNGKPREIARLYFPQAHLRTLTVNDRPLFLQVRGTESLRIPFSFSALGPNTISLGDTTQTVHIDKIKQNDFITVFNGEEPVKLDIFPTDMPSYKVKGPGRKTEGYLLLSLFEGSCHFPSYAYIVQTNGDLLYYRKNDHTNRCVSDFKKTVLPNGEVVFSMMEQEKPMPPASWWYGSLLVFDSKLNLITKLKLLPTEKHPQLDIENHESLILDKNHVILSTYYQTEIMIPGEEYPSRVAATLIQEIKDGKVIFEWDSTDHPQLYRACLGSCDWKQVSYQDYLHFNSLAVDPKDNNLVLSFAAASSIIKIDRNTGEILWTLGGRNDNYSLRAHQYFAGQHTVSFLPTGELLLFDNHSDGVAKKQKIFFPIPNLNTLSRILIFKLDEKNRRVEHFEEIKLSYFANTMGSVYRTENDTFMVGYGSSRDMLAQEMDQDGKVSLSVKLDTPVYVSYRVQKYNSLN